MNTSTVRFYSYDYGQAKTYLIAALFVLGNIALPQLCHLIPHGGQIFLPIYFFTILGAYKYGWRVGIITALASPLVNSLAFGMPATAALPAIIVKSVFLALAAGYVASHFRRISLLLMAGVVVAGQFLGSLFEWAYTGSAAVAMQDFRLGIPGMIIQVFGCWAVIKYVIRK